MSRCVDFQLSLVDPSQDKFCQFLSATLESLSLLLEVTAFSDIGKVFVWLKSSISI